MIDCAGGFDEPAVDFYLTLIEGALQGGGLVGQSLVRRVLLDNDVICRIDETRVGDKPIKSHCKKSTS